jgi:uncharacterized protein
MSAALSACHAGLQQVVIVGDGNAFALERSVAARYHPFAVVLALSPAEQQALAGLLPWLAAMHSVRGEAAAYVCRDFACRQPVTTPQALEGQFTPAVKLAPQDR